MSDRAEGEKLLQQLTGGVSRETLERLEAYVETLRQWQSVKNLVGPETLAHIWTRHVADSAQLVPHIPPGARIADLGSGAGLPGLVLACCLEGTGAHVTLVEANGRKCGFLRAAARAAGVKVTVVNARIEDALAAPDLSVDIVTARALAPLPELLRLAFPLLAQGAIGLFHKGRDVDEELTDSARYWSIEHELLPSGTHEDGRLLLIRGCRPRSAA
ncbi:16S rRNA (guanine(527)-N(7))-methyltransferase RsmG [Lutibaculum baratangense]|uniref:Ribosomal RNA small subunit methyltransferase G n=1 Tax=Lutibaculum baratangense AMV1 TaxID=631454 RepID=V4RJ04_9HYPH|nr:16S rRNA (guanine(527)-N(7))-methyltransferase RsmG [Lutibaculum baratangense]ESR26066.1 rRNA small subunit 7-methylguanosine (m7G) methyltransferase GidB [Lutibaculum baratangense AMV1]